MLQRISERPDPAQLAASYSADTGPAAAGVTIAGIFSILRRRIGIVGAATGAVLVLTLAFIRLCDKA